MTKRYGNFKGNNSKKQKVEDDLDALWGDDLDEAAIDDCIKRASQVCEEGKSTFIPQTNESILPSYNGFKNPNALFCSTQLDLSCKPSTSKYSNSMVSKKYNSTTELEEQIKNLNDQFKEKEGEVSILRSQLKETRASIQIEQQKAHSEWREKLNVSQKEMKTIKSELEFKNLEIGNLKQKLLHVTKHMNLDITISGSQAVTSQKPKVESKIPVQKVLPNVRKQAILEPYYPLKSLVSPSIFTIPCKEKYAEERKLNNLCRNTIPYLKNQISRDSNISANLKFRSVLVDKKELHLNFVYPEILVLINCTQEDMHLKENIRHVNKIICVSLQFLSDFHDYLTELENSTKIENIQQIDSVYIDNKFEDNLDFNDPNFFDKNECGFKAGQTLNFLAELLPYCSYLKKIICHNKLLVFEETENYVKNIPCMLNRSNFSEPFYFLNLLLRIVTLIGRIRKAHVTSVFLCAVVKLLINICRSKEFNQVDDIFCKITKEVLFSRPRLRVMYQLTFLFKLASLHSNFVEYLFTKPNSAKLKTNSKKGVFYFNEDSCRFYIFAVLCDNTLLKLKNQDFPLNVCLNLLSFIYNSYKWSFSVHHQVVKGCECLPQLYKLEIETVFKALEKYNEELLRNKRISEEWKIFFNHKITLKVLSLMSFNSYELTEKYVTVYSQYKEVERKLLEDDINDLEKLSMSEDIQEIPSTSFSVIGFLRD